MQFNIGDRVVLRKSALSTPYIANRLSYTNMYEGKRGVVIAIAETGKYAVQFDDIVFTRPNGIISSHDNACHGRGKQQHCWYIKGVDLIEERLWNRIQSSCNPDENLLLLLL